MIQGRKTKTAELAEKLKAEIREKKLPKDSPFLSVRELAGRFGISTSTAARILKRLEEEGILYQKPQSGTFVKHGPETLPVIAYAGLLPEPGNPDPVRCNASFRLLAHFAELGIQPVLISYYDLLDPEAAAQKLEKTEGLLVYDGFLDDKTRKTLLDYTGKIAVIGKTFPEDFIPCCQVFPDFTEPLLEFDRFQKFDGYEKILIVRASHPNSSYAAEAVRRVLKVLAVSPEKIEEVRLETEGSLSAYIQASQYFFRRRDLPDRTLIVSLSEFFSQAIRDIFSKGGNMPDILSFDNMEGYRRDPEAAPFFTSIDWHVDRMSCRALDLLCEQLKDPEAELKILRDPAELIIRKSVKTAFPVRTGEV